MRSWLQRVGVTTLFIEPGSPWENGYVESFNGKLRDECRNPAIFTTLTEAQILFQRWRREYTQVRPHSALGYRPPAPEALEIEPPYPHPLGRQEVLSDLRARGRTGSGAPPRRLRYAACISAISDRQRVTKIRRCSARGTDWPRRWRARK